MINVITLNDKQVASFNGYSIGSYNDNEVTQAITNDNKEPLFDATGIENIDGLTYPFKISVKCNDERLSITPNSIMYSKILQDDKNNNPAINITNWLENTNLRPVSNTTAPFSQWNTSFETSTGVEDTTYYPKYIINMEDLPAYTYNLDGVTSNLYINYTTGEWTAYYHGANYFDIKESVDIEWLTWKDHYMTDVFNITTSEWTYKATDSLPVIQDYSNTYKPIDLKIRNLTNDVYSGNFITFDFSEYKYKHRRFKIGLTVYQNEQAKEEGKYTLYHIELNDYIPTPEYILKDFNTTDRPVVGIAPGDKISQDLELFGYIDPGAYIFTLYAPPFNLNHDQDGHEGYMANRFDIRYILFDNYES